jgi:hypothetical protein
MEVGFMSDADKGERYARIFRKAGLFLVKGNIARAVAVLKEGHSIAIELSDLKMAERFALEIANAEKPADPQG